MNVCFFYKKNTAVVVPLNVLIKLSKLKCLRLSYAIVFHPYHHNTYMHILIL